MSVTVVDHPLAGHLLLAIRDQTTRPAVFRTLTKKLTTVLMLEATRDLPTRERTVETPLEEATGRSLAGPIVVVPVLRAGLGMLDAVVDLFPEVRVGYLGLERDEATFQPSEYYANRDQEVAELLARLHVGLDRFADRFSASRWKRQESIRGTTSPGANCSLGRMPAFILR